MACNGPNFGVWSGDKPLTQEEPFVQLGDLKSRLEQIVATLNLDKIQQEIASLALEASQSGLWDNPERAQAITSTLSQKRTRLDQIGELHSILEDASVLLTLASEESEPTAIPEAIANIETAEGLISLLETETLLNGDYDNLPAIVTIRSGAGGDDATDFAEKLLRMYLRYAERNALDAKLIDASYAEGAGIRSASVKFEAPYAFGKLSVESGTHRLVRMSPFNAAGKRQTSFAAVEVVPLIESDESIELPDNEIRVDVFRSSGPGGQSVNTTDSAVRITHLPTGIVVSCQNEKSQLQNKLEAMRVLQSRLLELARQEEEAKKKQLAGDVKASWGEQIRSYVLAPYQMVKDLRTLHEENKPDDVFDGKIEGFIAAGIKWRAQQNR